MFIEDRYDVEIDDTVSLFEFVSEGKKFNSNKKDKTMTINKIREFVKNKIPNVQI